MNRIIEDRLLIDECEQAVLVLRDILRSTRGANLRLGIKSADDLLEKIKKHREKFTRRVLDKQEYIKKNKALFDVIYERDNRIGGSYFEKTHSLDSIECEKKIREELVAGGFYSSKTARADMIRSLMTTYEKLYIKNQKE
jgi:hypothetical protein